MERFLNLGILCLAHLRQMRRGSLVAVVSVIAAVIFSTAASAQNPAAPPEARGDGPSSQAASHRPGGEANLVLPDLASVDFMDADGAGERMMASTGTRS